MLHPTMQIRYQFVKIYLLLMKQQNRGLQTISTVFNHGITTLSGEGSRLTTQNERNTFGIGTDIELRDLVESGLNRWPNDAFLRDPTHLQQSFTSMRLEAVTTRLLAIGIKLLDISEQNSMVADQYFTNHSSTESTANFSLSANVTNMTSSNWIQAHTADFGSLVIIGTDLRTSSPSKIPMTANFRTLYGQGVTVHPDFAISGGQFSVPVGPGETIVAELHATRATAIFEVTYEIRLVGDVLSHFNPPHNGLSFYGSNIDGLFQSAKKPNSSQIKQIVEIATFGNPNMRIRAG